MVSAASCKTNADGGGNETKLSVWLHAGCPRRTQGTAPLFQQTPGNGRGAGAPGCGSVLCSPGGLPVSPPEVIDEFSRGLLPAAWVLAVPREVPCAGHHCSAAKEDGALQDRVWCQRWADVLQSPSAKLPQGKYQLCSLQNPTMRVPTGGSP